MLLQFLCEWLYALSLYGQNMPFARSRSVPLLVLVVSRYTYFSVYIETMLRAATIFAHQIDMQMIWQRTWAPKIKSRNLFIFLRHRRCHHHHGRFRCRESELWYNCKSFRFKVDGESEKDIWVNFYRCHFWMLLLLLLAFSPSSCFRSLGPVLSHCHHFLRSNIIMYRITKICVFFATFLLSLAYLMATVFRTESERISRAFLSIPVRCRHWVGSDGGGGDAAAAVSLYCTGNGIIWVASVKFSN